MKNKSNILKGRGMRTWYVFTILFFILASCGDDSPRTNPDPWVTDSIPPAAISDLNAAPGTDPGSVLLTWTAVGDDDLLGHAQTYVLKYSTSPINSLNFYSATTYSQSWSAAYSGQPESETVTGLLAGTTYYFAIKTLDEVPNTALISNVPSATTTAGLHAVGWIGGGMSGWVQYDGASVSQSLYGFDTPRGVWVTSSGTIYVADHYNHRICKWNSSGTSVQWIGGGQDGWQTGPAPASGTDYQSFYRPWDVCVDSSGNIYVSDYSNYRVCKWDSAGNALGWLGGGQDGWQTGPAPLNGTDYQSFNSIQGLFVDSSGNIYVADSGSHCIRKWSSVATALGWIGCGYDGWQTGEPGTSSIGLKGFFQPGDVWVDLSGNIYVISKTDNRICKWSTLGVAQGWIGHGYDGWQTGPADLTSGYDLKSFDYPVALCVDSLSNIYVADKNNNRVCKWNSSGIAVGWFGAAQNGWQTGSAPTSYGSDFQSFNSPAGLYSFGNTIYIADRNNHRISKWQE